MMGEAKHETRAVFTATLALNTPEERARYLDETCQDKPELRKRVEALLRAHEQASSFLEAPAAPSPRKTIVFSPPLTEKPGDKIGRYKLLEEIGEGAFGRVFMAEQTEPVCRKVALKIIKAGMDTREVIARFEAERQALALMDHPNIAKVLDAGATETGRPYFAMELVRGIPITAYCEQQHLSTAERLQLFMKVCAAVQHAHQKGIIHRDLKPTNILVTLIDGEAVPKVIDFGIAKALGQKLTEKTLFTGFQQMIGTPAYMSPEQAALSGVDVDTRSDIYSLGVLLYELLTGVTPFDQETLRKAALDEICRIIRETEPPKPSTRLTQLARIQNSEVRSQKWKEVRGDLDLIVMKCLEKDRARRYETANSLADDIGHHLNLEPVNAAAPSTFYRARKFIRRHKTGLATAIALVLLLVAGAAISTWQAVRATRAEHAQSHLRQRAEAEKDRADAKTREAEAHVRQIAKEKEIARFNLYLAQISLLQQKLENQRVGSALSLLEGLRPKEGEEDLRGFEWYYLWRQCNRGLLATLRGHEKSVEALAFSPDGTALVSASRDGTVRSWALNSGPEQETLGRMPTLMPGVEFSRGGKIRVEFSRDGKVLAVGNTNGTITLWDTSSRTERTSIKAHTSAVSGLAFSPDSRRLASGGRDRMVRVWDVNTGEAAGPAWEHPDANAPPGAVAFSADGRLLAANSYGAIKVYELATGQLRQTLAGHRFWIRCLAFFPDGKTLVSGGNNETIKFWDLGTGQEKIALERAGDVEKLAVSPDGTRLALGHDDGTLEVWDVQSGERRVFGHSERINTLAFSPDGSRLASGSLDRTVKLWDLRSPSDPPPAKGQEHRIWSVAFSPDGKLLVFSPEGGDTRILEVATGEKVATLGFSVAAAFSPDGKTLAAARGNGVVLWDVGAWQQRAAFSGHADVVFAVRFSPDGKALASGSKDGTIFLWDIATRRRRATLDGHPSKWVWSVAFSPDSACLASAGGEYCGYGEAVLWDVATGQKRAGLPRGTTWVAFSPDGRTLASGLLGGSIGLWDAATGRLRTEMSAPEQFTRVMAFLPDGKALVSCNDEGSITIWDTVRWQQRATLRKGHTSVYSLAVSPDGRTLATGGVYGDVEFWRAADEREVTSQGPAFEHLIELAGGSSRQGALLQERGRDVEAQNAYLDAVALYESAGAQIPGRSESKQGLAVTYGRLVRLAAGSSQLPAQDCNRALALADKAIARTETNTNALADKVAFCCDKAKLLEKAGRAEAALATFTQAIEWGSADTNACASILKEARLGRGGVLQRMNRLAEALDDRCQALNIPRRDAQTGTNLVDLTQFYNAGLGNNLAALLHGVQTLAQVQFDLRGLIGLSPRNPASVAGIPIHRKFARLHVLHGTGWGEEEATKIGAYVLHYADGQQSELPILYGQDVRDLWQSSDPRDATRATVAWTGPNPELVEPDALLRLFKRTWDNPRPEVEVESLEFTTTGTKCAPFLVALTVE